VGILHRNISLEHILLRTDKEIALTGFRRALLPGEEAKFSVLHGGPGSAAYYAPEVLQDDGHSIRSDLYSIGLCFYEALYGSHPFEHGVQPDQIASNPELKVIPLHEFNSRIPKHLSTVISKLMSYAAEDRYQSANHAIRDLADVADLTTGD
jgi:serine/threonine-protein kinase